MRPLAHRMFALFMAALVLVSGTGLGVVEHSCAFKGTSKHLVFDEADCHSCPSGAAQKLREGGWFSKKKCCSEKLTFEKIDVSLHISAKTMAADQVLQVAYWQHPILSFCRQEWRSRLVSPQIFTFSSRLHGRSLLVFGQVFVI